MSPAAGTPSDTRADAPDALADLRPAQASRGGTGDTRRPLSSRIRGGGLLELAGAIALYLAFDDLRDRVMGSGRVALAHGRDVVRLERAVGLYHERALQQSVLGSHAFLSWWNIYYGTIHFAMPVFALVVLYRRAPARYVRWRTTLVALLGVGLLAFWAYPLMPPRLMPAPYGFVDTAARFFNFGPQQPVHLSAAGIPDAASVRNFGNLFAAMPSLHVGWATWSAFALLPLTRRRWLKIALLCYPFVTIYAVVVTANHWFLDALGGWVALAVAYGLVLVGERSVGMLRHRRRPRVPTVR